MSFLNRVTGKESQALQQKIDEIQKRLNGQINENDSLIETNNKYAVRIDLLQKSLEQYMTDIAKLKDELKEKNTLLIQEQSLKDDAFKALDQANNMIGTCEATIDAVNIDLLQKNDALNSMIEEVSKLKTQLESRPVSKLKSLKAKHNNKR